MTNFRINGDSGYSETLENFYQITRHYIPKYMILRDVCSLHKSVNPAWESNTCLQKES